MSTDAMQDSVIFLTYGQLIDAMVSSHVEYETRFTAFTIAADRAVADPSQENQVDALGKWSACEVQADMNRAIASEITRRVLRTDYA